MGCSSSASTTTERANGNGHISYDVSDKSVADPRDKRRTALSWIRYMSSLPPVRDEEPLKQVSLQELSTHNTTKNTWLSIKGKVYNVTPYLDYHPGGEEELMKGAGKDATQLFYEAHRWVNYETMLQRFLVGNLEHSPQESTPETCFYPCKIVLIREITPDTKLISLDTQQKITGEILGRHVSIRHTINGADVIRNYTLVVPDFFQKTIDTSKMHLIIKMYSDGALTSWMNSLTAGNVIHVSLPEGHFPTEELNHCSEVRLYAAGSGITPMIPIIHHCLHHPSEHRKTVKLLYFNKTEKDIIWCSEFQGLQNKFKWFTVEHVLSRESDNNWSGLRGRLRPDLITDHSDKLSCFICICGPVLFAQSAVRMIQEKGFPPENIHVFQGSLKQPRKIN